MTNTIESERHLNQILRMNPVLNHLQSILRLSSSMEESYILVSFSSSCIQVFLTHWGRVLHFYFKNCINSNLLLLGFAIFIPNIPTLFHQLGFTPAELKVSGALMPIFSGMVFF